MSESFSQMFCSLAPCGAGGRVIIAQRMRNCLVQVADGELTLIQAPSTLVAKAPAAAVEIVTPRTLRKVGTGVILLLGGKLLSVEFDVVYRLEQEYAKRRARTGVAAFGHALQQVFSISPITSFPQSVRLGRRLTSEFSAALVAAGATDRVSA